MSYDAGAVKTDRTSKQPMEAAAIIAQHQRLLDRLPEVASQPGPGLLPDSEEGRAYLAAYHLAREKLAAEGVEVLGVGGSIREGRARLGIYGRDAWTFETVAAADKSPFNQELWATLGDDLKAVAGAGNLEALAVKLSGASIPSDVDVTVRADPPAGVARRIAAEVFEATGVLVEISTSSQPPIQPRIDVSHKRSRQQLRLENAAEKTAKDREAARGSVRQSQASPLRKNGVLGTKFGLGRDEE